MHAAKSRAMLACDSLPIQVAYTDGRALLRDGVDDELEVLEILFVSLRRCRGETRNEEHSREDSESHAPKLAQSPEIVGGGRARHRQDGDSRTNARSRGRERRLAAGAAECPSLEAHLNTPPSRANRPRRGRLTATPSVRGTIEPSIQPRSASSCAASRSLPPRHTMTWSRWSTPS